MHSMPRVNAWAQKARDMGKMSTVASSSSCGNLYSVPSDMHHSLTHCFLRSKLQHYLLSAPSQLSTSNMILFSNKCIIQGSFNESLLLSLAFAFLFSRDQIPTKMLLVRLPSLLSCLACHLITNLLVASKAIPSDEVTSK